VYGDAAVEITIDPRNAEVRLEPRGLADANVSVSQTEIRFASADRPTFESAWRFGFPVGEPIEIRGSTKFGPNVSETFARQLAPQIGHSVFGH
jgi:hypothetical protein